MSHPASTAGEQPTTHTPVGLIAFAWALVGVPLAYGLYNTVKAASALFG
ncbi:MFS transporter small subunit [Blastococcus sp. SYSU DS0533]